MCGIAALLKLNPAACDASVIRAMTEAVSHRGPDGADVAYLQVGDRKAQRVDAGSAWQVALGHRRLSILDLSDAGRQPMLYRESLWLTYNGEIYNYVELRRELSELGHTFQSHTDSEVVLAAYAEWGTDCFRRFHGMWGLVIVDPGRGQAVLSRDRLGIKPLYVARGESLLAIVSEIKQLASVPTVTFRPDEDVLQDYLHTGYEQAGRSFYKGVTPVAPGCWQILDLSTAALSAAQSYWFPERIAVSVKDPVEAAESFVSMLRQSVRIHMRSDVPVGCALSGGLDSSAIAACIVGMETTQQALQTFSVAFPNSPIDEQGYAQQVAEFVKSVPRYVTPSAERFLEDLDRFVWIHDEPVGSLSQYAGFALARLTREASVPVTLNGQGGDEVLGGYWQSYFMHLRGLLRGGDMLRLCGHFLGALGARGNPELTRQVPLMLRRYRSRRRGSQASNIHQPVASARGRLERLMSMNEQERRVFEIREMYLPRLLKWDDRNYMAFGIEGRYPFLDHALIELALTFAPSALYSKGWTKEPLRRGLIGKLPHAVLRRRTKFGFETPQDDWLCGRLRPALETWLASDGPLWQYKDQTQVQAVAQQVWHLNGKQDEPGQQLLRMYFADRWLRVFFN